MLSSRLSLAWSKEDEGVSANTHNEYLQRFSDWFYCSVVKQVDAAVKQRLSLAQDALVTEAMQVRCASSALVVRSMQHKLFSFST